MANILVIEDFVDCESFLNGLHLYRMDQIEAGVSEQVKQLHGALGQIYKEVEGYDLVGVIMHMDATIELGFDPSGITAYLEKPIRQPYFVFDIKTHNKELFVAIYYAWGNGFQELCVEHGFKYVVNKHLWVFRHVLQDGQELLEVLSQLNEFFESVKKICRVFVHRSTMQKYYRVI